nr:hypothetical protein GCM10017547_31920 [Pseudarthrobacter oxydans]
MPLTYYNADRSIIAMIVETETSYYLLDLGAMTLKRVPRDAPVHVPNSQHNLPAAVVSLRKDGEAIPFTFLAPLEVGKPARFLLHLREGGVETTRSTTDVLSVTSDL